MHLKALVICLLVAMLSPAYAQDQAGPPPKLPLVSAVSEIIFLEDAKQSSARAKRYEVKNRMFEAMQEYEAVIEKAEKLPSSLRHTYEFYVVVAAAHLDTARIRNAYGREIVNSLKLAEQNRRLITDHLNAVPNLVVAAIQDASRSPEFETFRCNARKLLAQGQSLMGIINQSPNDLRAAVKVYKAVVACDPDSAKKTRKMISYITGPERDISHSPLSADNVVKVVKTLVALSVPRFANYVSPAIELGYDFYKQKKQAPTPPELRR